MNDPTDEYEFNDQFSIDKKSDDRMYLVCSNCYWLFLLAIYPSVDGIFQIARAHYAGCKKEAKVP